MAAVSHFARVSKCGFSSLGLLLAALLIIIASATARPTFSSVMRPEVVPRGCLLAIDTSSSNAIHIQGYTVLISCEISIIISCLYSSCQGIIYSDTNWQDFLDRLYCPSISAVSHTICMLPESSSWPGPHPALPDRPMQHGSLRVGDHLQKQLPRRQMQREMRTRQLHERQASACTNAAGMSPRAGPRPVLHGSLHHSPLWVGNHLQKQLLRGLQCRVRLAASRG